MSDLSTYGLNEYIAFFTNTVQALARVVMNAVIDQIKQKHGGNPPFVFPPPDLPQNEAFRNIVFQADDVFRQIWAQVSSQAMPVEDVCTLFALCDAANRHLVLWFYIRIHHAQSSEIKELASFWYRILSVLYSK